MSGPWLTGSAQPGKRSTPTGLPPVAHRAQSGMVGTIDGITRDRSRSARWQQRRCSRRIDQACRPSPIGSTRATQVVLQMSGFQHRRGFRQRGDENPSSARCPAGAS